MSFFTQGEDIIFNVHFLPGVPTEVLDGSKEEFKKRIFNKNSTLIGLDYKQGSKVLENGNTAFYMVFVCPADGEYTV